MKHLLASLAIGSALCTIPGIALAQTAMASPMPMMPGMKPPAMAATMMCRPAMSGEKATAMMGTTGLVCKMMSGMMKDGMMMVPDTKGMDAAAANKAWLMYLQSAVLIAPGGNG